MDPFSITVGIVGVLGVALQTLQLAQAYAEAGDGKKAAAELLTELSALHSNFSRLDEFLKSKSEAGRHFGHTSVLATSTTQCRKKLDDLHTVLQNKLCGESQNRMSSLRWPLSVKEHRSTIEELRAFSHCIQLALTTDGCELLSKTSTEVQQVLKKQQDTLALLERLDDRASSAEEAWTKQAQSIDDERLARERHDVLNWLSTFKHEQKHDHVAKPHVDGTGEWLLRMDKFEHWRDELKPGLNVLCCYGIQGSGKSVLASFVIDRLTACSSKHNVAIAYFYFDYREQDHQSAQGMLASLLKQLAIAKPRLPHPIVELHQRLTRQQRQPKQEDLEDAILLTCAEFGRVFLVIDALDECDKEQRKEVLGALRNLSKWQPHSRRPMISIFVTSRPHPNDIMKTFETFPKITIEAQTSDVRKYVYDTIENSDDPDAIDEGFRNVIVEKISQGARQMFLLAVLQTKTVLNEPTMGAMEEALEKMPRDLDDALECTLSRIRKQPDGRRRLGMNTLMWISHARRPLLVTELSEALAVRIGDKSLNAKNRPTQKVIVDSCMGLVTVDENTLVVRLVHYSVQEYLHKHQNRLFPNAERIIAEASITYILFDVFGVGIGCRSDRDEIESLIIEHPFVAYASRQWGYHVKTADNEEIETLALDFLRSQSHRACSYQLIQYVGGRREEYWEPIEASSCNALTIAAVFGLDRLVKQLLDTGEVTVDSTTHMGSTALMRATSEGHQTLTDLLLSRNADLKKQNWYGTALHCTAESGNVTCIRQLVAAMDVDFRDRYGRTSLHCATISGQIATMKALLEQGADVNAICNSGVCDRGCTPLRYAVICEYPAEVVKTLLDYGAKSDVSTSLMITPLHDAVGLNLQEILELLLEHGADVNAKTASGITPLQLAAGQNHTTVLDSLLKHGADINAQMNDGATALCIAAERGYGEAVTLLLHNDANTELETDERLTALDIAIREGYDSVIRKLLEAGAQDRLVNGAATFDFRFAYESVNVKSSILEDDGTGQDHHDSGEAEDLDLLHGMILSSEIQRKLEYENRLSNHSKIITQPWRLNDPGHWELYVKGKPTEKAHNPGISNGPSHIPTLSTCPRSPCTYATGHTDNRNRHVIAAHDWPEIVSKSEQRIGSDDKHCESLSEAKSTAEHDKLHEDDATQRCFTFDIERHSPSPPRYNSGIMRLSQIPVSHEVKIVTNEF